jgi:hypothetical protein
MTEDMDTVRLVQRSRDMARHAETTFRNIADGLTENLMQRGIETKRSEAVMVTFTEEPCGYEHVPGEVCIRPKDHVELERLADRIIHNLNAFREQQPEGPTEMDMVIDPIRAYLKSKSTQETHSASCDVSRGGACSCPTGDPRRKS